MKNHWLLFLVFIFSVTVSVDVQRTGLGTFEQPLLIGTYGLSLSDTAWPPLLRNLAFSVRVLVALLSDLYSPLGLGHRLPFILLGQTLCCAGFLACALYPPYPGSGFSLYLGMALGRSLAMVMAQCALDGLVVDAGVPHLQGVIQQVRATGTMVGVLVTNLGGAAIAEAWGLPALCLAYAILTAPLLPLPLALARGAVEERASGGASRAEKFDCSAFSALRHPHALAVLFLAVATFLGQTIANFPLTVFLVSEKRLTLLDIGALGTISAVTSWPGSLLAGWLLDRQDVRAPIAACQALNAALTLAVLWTPPSAAFAFNAALNAASGLATGLVFSCTLGIALRTAPPPIAASYMAIIQGACNLAGVLGNLAVAQIATLPVQGAGGRYAVAFSLGAALILASAGAVAFLGQAALPPCGGGEAGRGKGSSSSSDNVLLMATAAAAAVAVAGAGGGAGALAGSGQLLQMQVQSAGLEEGAGKGAGQGEEGGLPGSTQAVKEWH